MWARRGAIGPAAVLLGATLAAGVGCATPKMRDPSVQISTRRLIAVPSTGMVWEWDASGKRTISDERSVAAMKNVDESVAYRLSLHGGRVLPPAAFETFKWAAPCSEWSNRMMQEIMSERLGHSLAKHESVSEWRYGRGLAEWRERLAADFLLVSFFLDGHNTTGRTVIVHVGGGWLAARRAIACVVRLEDGRVVWCNLIQFATELLERRGAQFVADALLREVLGNADAGGPAKAGPTAAGQPAGPK